MLESGRVRFGTTCQTAPASQWQSPLPEDLAATASMLCGNELVTATGRVVDGGGKPVEHATVLVYEARVKKGYSLFCPTCYTDCGKRSSTDADGNFAIGGLSGDLLFTFLVVRDGYSTVYLTKVDPVKGPTENAVLKPRPSIDDPSQLVRGRVVDARGKPLRRGEIGQEVFGPDDAGARNAADGTDGADDGERGAGEMPNEQLERAQGE